MGLLLLSFAILGTGICLSINEVLYMIKPGDLVEIISAPDQSLYERSFCGKLGIVIENIYAKSSPNIWRVFVEDRFVHLHMLDLKVVQPAKEKNNE
jgi:hypothetical protein